MTDGWGDLQCLNIYDDVSFDDVIIKKEFHTYLPTNNSSLGYNDEIRIPILNQDIYTLLCDSYLFLEGKLTSTDATTKLVRNCYAFLFDEMRLEINGVEIDRVREVGYTSTLKNLVSLDKGESEGLVVAGFDSGGTSLIGNEFHVCLPLKYFMGFAEFYKKIFINCRIELILLRSHNDDNCFKGKDGKITLDKIQWHVPHVGVNDETKLQLYNTLKADQPIKIAFHRWELYDIPNIKATLSDKWAIRTKSQLEKPRYVIIGFQTNKRNNPIHDASEFSNCEIRNLKLFLNDTYFPYDKQNYDFAKGNYAQAYYNYLMFQKSYYGREHPHPILSFKDFKTSPIFVIDCSKQVESLVTSTVDIQLEYESNKEFMQNTSIFALILHDALYEYIPTRGVVTRLI